MTAVLLAGATGALGGCEVAGEAGGNRTFSSRGVPFEFQVPSDFTDAPIDQGDSRGDVVAGTGTDKLDVIAVRRVGRAKLPAGPVAHVVQGSTVISVLHPVADGWAIECQYRPERASSILSACRGAVESVRRSAGR